MDSLREDAAAFGIDPATVVAPVTETDDAFPIYPENWAALNVFLSLSNAWTLHLPAMGGKPLWRGIPRQEIAATLQLMGLWRERLDIMPRLLILESEALKSLNRE